MWQVVYMVVMLVLSYALQPKPQKPKPAAFEDFDFPTADDGTPQIVVFGDVWLTDWTVIGIGNYRNQAIKKSTGGLFSKSVTSGYKYLMSLHMGLCRGIDDLVEIKISDKTAWTGTIGSDNKTSFRINQPNLFGGDDSEGGIVGNLTILRGAPDQATLNELERMYGTVIQEGHYTEGSYYEPKVWIPAVIEPATVPAYRGVVTFFYDGLVCSNSPYPKPWSFRVRRITSNWDGSVWYPAKAVIWLNDNTIQAMNPAHIIYEAQTNSVWGRGFAASQLDLASFQAAADQLYSENFGICLAWRRQENLSEFIQQIVDTIGAALYLDRMTGLWKLVLVRANYDVDTLPLFTSVNGLLKIEDDNNAANDVASNQTIVTYRDPITNQDQQIRAENIAAIQKFGVISENKTYAGIPTANLAGRIAARDMKIAQSGLKKFKLIFDRRAYQMQPLSVFKISAQEQGIESLVLRAIKVEHSEIINGQIAVTALQDVFGLADQNFIGSQPSLHQPPQSSALPVSNPIIYEVPFFELLQDFSTADLQAKSGQGYFAVAAAQPSSLHISFDLLAKASNEVSFANVGTSDFAFISTVTIAVAQTATAVTVSLADSITNIEVGDRAMLGSEIVRVDAVDLQANTVTLARGCIDTEPQNHEIGTRFSVYSNLNNAANRIFNIGETANLKFITRTSSDQLNEATATVYSAQLSNRLARPYPPAQVQINGEYFPEQVSGDLTLSWSHRNRLTQTGQAPSFTDGSTAHEAGTTYNLKIFDANNIELLNKVEAESPCIWNVPKRFDGEMTTLFELGIDGAENSINFTDLSPNHFTVNNPYAVRIQTDENVGKVASISQGSLIALPAQKLVAIVQEDHCIEYRIKTLKYPLSESDGIPTFHMFVDRTGSSITPDHSYMFISTKINVDSMIISVSGKEYGSGWIGADKTIDYEATGLSSDEYVDIAIQVTLLERRFNTGTNSFINSSLVTIYVDGIAAVSDTLEFIFLENLHENVPKLSVILSNLVGGHTGSAVIMNGFRITQRTGGRYTGDYVPAAFKTGSSDPLWEDVVLLLPLIGSNFAQNFVDISNAPTTIVASPNFHTFQGSSFFGGAFTVVDSKAHGGSAMCLTKQALYLDANSVFDLGNTSFVIEGRIMGYGTILRMAGSRTLENAGTDVCTLWKIEINQYFLTITGFTDVFLTPTTSVSLPHNYIGGSGKNVDDTYFDFKVFFDAGTGKVTLWFNELYTVGDFTLVSDISPKLIIGDPNNNLSVNALKIQSAETGAGLIVDVNNPVRIELESQRDGLASYQKFVTSVTVI